VALSHNLDLGGSVSCRFTSMVTANAEIYISVSGSRRLGQSTSTRSTYLSNSKIKLQISFSRAVENMINKALDPVYEFDPNADEE